MALNTDGGGLSSNHPGMRGIFLLLEATTKLRGQFDGTGRQVPGIDPQYPRNETPTRAPPGQPGVCTVRSSRG